MNDLYVCGLRTQRVDGCAGTGVLPPALGQHRPGNLRPVAMGVVKASKRTDQLQSDGSMICGKLLLRPDVGRAYWQDADLDLTLGEYNIVHMLASNLGRYVTYRAIYDRLHYEGFIAGSGPDGYRANVRSAIKRIRNKFRDLDPTFDKIENYTGFGYCWRKTPN